MRFKYLKDIYSEFKQRVDEELANQESNEDFDKIKHVLYQLLQLFASIETCLKRVQIW